MRFDAYLPTRLVCGAGRFDEAGLLARSLGRQALVVTSRSAMARLGYTRRLLEQLSASDVGATVFSDLGLTPTSDDVDRAADAARSCGADLVIGLGGGSALDCAKATAGVAAGRISCAEYLHGRASIGPAALPILAIPTTAGTASEMNRSAIITDTAAQHKDAIRSDYLFPRIALVDPLLTHEMPREITAQTGFDALAHAIESYVSPKAQPLADAWALAAIAAIVESLPTVLAEPHNASARERMCLASTSMGYNLSCVGTCLPHRLDKPLCAFYPQIAHAQAVAFFYPAWASHGWAGCPEKFARIAALLEPATAELPVDQAAEACAGLFAQFIERAGLGRPMSSFGVHLTEAEANHLAQRVSGDTRVNPIPVEPSQLVDFYHRAFAE